MSDVLYRKYRSRSFAEVKGQSVIVQVLQQSISSGKVAHAYLFSGPRGTGKTSLARLLAKGVNCTNFAKTKDVCNECDACRLIEEGSHLDVVEIDAASNRGIDEIRQLKESVNFLPVQGNYKVYIIDEVHMLTKEAFNALLKTLEEPPQRVIFILATTEAHKVPVTIISRVQRFDFRLASREELYSKLKYISDQEGIEIDEDALRVMFDYTEGSYRDAESLLGKAIAHAGEGNKKITYSDIESALGVAPDTLVGQVFESLLQGDALSVLNLVEQADEGGVNLEQMLKQLLNKAKNTIKLKLESGEGYGSELSLLGSLIATQGELKVIDNPKLLFEILAFKYGKTGQSVRETTGFEESVPIAPKGDNKSKKLNLKGRSAGKRPLKKDTANQDQWAILLDMAKEHDFKVWTALKMCGLSIEGQKVVLTTSLGTVAEQLNEFNREGKLANLVTTVYGDDFSLDIAVNAEDIQVVDISSSDIVGGGMLKTNANLVEQIL